MRRGCGKHPTRKNITTNSKLPFRERTKTILHEVAHFLLHHANYLRPVFLDHKSFVAGLEKEADYFAYLLMQEWLEEEGL
ncbi:MAG: ImmA/IrrE family metallo-endopeptidase [Atribacterales bacterium]